VTESSIAGKEQEHIFYEYSNHPAEKHSRHIHCSWMKNFFCEAEGRVDFGQAERQLCFRPSFLPPLPPLPVPPVPPAQPRILPSLPAQSPFLPQIPLKTVHAVHPGFGPQSTAGLSSVQDADTVSRLALKPSLIKNRPQAPKRDHPMRRRAATAPGHPLREALSKRLRDAPFPII